jgi:ribA/ribD-fused uncharacterized protein
MMNYDIDIPDYAKHDQENIKGFFGPTYRFLSNFWICPRGVEYDRNIYSSVEAAYHAAKVLPQCRADFLDVSPQVAKKLWERYPLVDKDASEWSKRRTAVMGGLVFSKFFRDVELRNKLMSTENMYLEESNDWSDCFWGVAYAGSKAKNSYWANRKCKNMLGGILTETREYWKRIQARGSCVIWDEDRDFLTEGESLDDIFKKA